MKFRSMLKLPKVAKLVEHYIALAEKKNAKTGL